MKSDMSKIPIREYLDLYGDGIHGTPEYADDGEYYFINGNNIKDGKINIDDNTLKVSRSEYEKIKRPLSYNSLLMSINGTLGNIGVYNGEKIALGKSACFLNVKEDCNKYFVKYLLSTKEFQKYIMLVAHGSTIKNLAPSQIADYVPELPDDIDVDRVAMLLKSIDDKIESNKQIVNTLEKMAKTLYDYWFVQFDFPDANGQPYKTSGGKMEWNETLSREIPAGWEVVRLADYCSLQRGVTYGKGDSTNIQQDGYEPILRANNIQNHELNFDSLVYLPKALIDKNQYLKEGDILIAMSSGSMEHIGKVARAFYNLNYGFGAFCSKMSPLSDTGKQYIYYYVISDEFQLYIHNMCLGTNIRNLTNDHILNSKLCKIPEKVLSKFESKIVHIHKKQAVLKQENIRLSCFRDFLLPMLMNGQVTFRK